MLKRKSKSRNSRAKIAIGGAVFLLCLLTTSVFAQKPPSIDVPEKLATEVQSADEKAKNASQAPAAAANTKATPSAIRPSKTPASSSQDNPVPTNTAAPVAPQTPKVAPANPPPSPNSIQINEQFSGGTLNTKLWQALTRSPGYRNNEEQAYRPSQVTVANGMLQITAARDANGQWYSGEVHSKWEYMYGDFEARIALSATGPGVWPAAWLMGRTDSWPDNGEIDIFENINGESIVHGTIHGGGNDYHWQIEKTFSPVNVTQFHTYKISKKPGIITWWVDGVQRGQWLQSQTPAGNVWPFESHANFGLLTLAIGGTWPGPSNASTPGSIIMYVDYFTVKNAY